MQELVIEMEERRKQLDKALSLFRKRGSDYAENEKNYRVELAKKILQERDKGTPVTIISDICRGDEKIAELRAKRDIAETLYESAKEAIQVMKLNIRVIDGQIDRETKGN
jgi:predicted nuclease with TOPRIM domain